jgi:hypothetical protein
MSCWRPAGPVDIVSRIHAPGKLDLPLMDYGARASPAKMLVSSRLEPVVSQHELLQIGGVRRPPHRPHHRIPTYGANFDGEASHNRSWVPESSSRRRNNAELLHQPPRNSHHESYIPSAWLETYSACTLVDRAPIADGRGVPPLCPRETEPIPRRLDLAGAPRPTG